MKVEKIPEWMPETYLKLVVDNGPIIEFKFSSAERKIMKKKKQILPSVWQESFRVLPDSSALAGPMKNRYTPYMIGIIDSAVFPGVETIIMCKCVQSGGSENIHSLMGSRSDLDPGNILYVYPNRDLGKKQLKKRILPMYKNSPSLKKYLTGSVNDENNLCINLKHITIDIAWAHSPASLASDAYRYVVFDETDKYPPTASKEETDPISLGEHRATTFRRRGRAIIVKISTPTTEEGYIWVALTKEAQVIFDYFVQCPFCNVYQVMVIENIKWDGGLKADYRRVESEFLAYYECKHCKKKWNDETRNRAVRKGEWRSRGKEIELFTYLKSFKPKKIGFHIPAWISFFVSLSESAAAYIKGETEGPTHKQNFDNNYAAVATKKVIVTSNVEQLLSHKTKIPEGIVPKEAIALTAGIDMQKSDFYFVVRAWARDLTSWLIQYGSLSNWKDLENLIFNTRYPVEGTTETKGIFRAALDTGGGVNEDDDWSRTEEAYEWLRDNSNGVIFGIKGSSKPQLQRVVKKVLDKMPGSSKPIPGGLELRFLDTHQLKDLLHFRLTRKDADEAIDQEAQSQRFYLHSGTDKYYAKQFLAEEKIRDRDNKIRWARKGSRANHLFDCEVYAAACADESWTPSIRFLAQIQDERASSNEIIKKLPKTEIITSNPQNIRNRQRPSWFYRK